MQENKRKRIPVIVAVVFVLVFVLVVTVGIGIMAVTGLGCSVGRYLVAENGTGILVVDNSPIVLSNRTNRELFDNLTIGDKILVFHGGIKESYPAGTGAYAVIKILNGSAEDIPQTVIDSLSELGWLADGTKAEDMYFNSGTKDDLIGGFALSYANWTEEPALYRNALNAAYFEENGAKHLPIYKFDSKDTLAQFEQTFADVLSFDQSYDEVPSFREAVQQYDDSFFADNLLIMVYVPANSGTYRFGVDGVYCDGMTFRVYVKQLNHPELVTDDMAGWFVTVAVEKTMLEGCTVFDAMRK